jgi:hypothetical protein
MLYEAARRVADRCGVSLEEAKAALDRAFREYVLVTFDSRQRHGGRLRMRHNRLGAQLDYPGAVLM